MKGTTKCTNPEREAVQLCGLSDFSASIDRVDFGWLQRRIPSWMAWFLSSPFERNDFSIDGDISTQASPWFAFVLGFSCGNHGRNPSRSNSEVLRRCSRFCCRRAREERVQRTNSTPVGAVNPAAVSKWATSLVNSQNACLTPDSEGQLRKETLPEGSTMLSSFLLLEAWFFHSAWCW